MNLYQIIFDATRITVKANSQDEAFEHVKARDSNFRMRLEGYTVTSAVNHGVTDWTILNK